jgi:hypothetical protein
VLIKVIKVIKDRPHVPKPEMREAIREAIREEINEPSPAQTTSASSHRGCRCEGSRDAC